MPLFSAVGRWLFGDSTPVAAQQDLKPNEHDAEQSLDSHPGYTDTRGQATRNARRDSGETSRRLRGRSTAPTNASSRAHERATVSDRTEDAPSGPQAHTPLGHVSPATAVETTAAAHPDATLVYIMTPHPNYNGPWPVPLNPPPVPVPVPPPADPTTISGTSPHPPEPELVSTSEGTAGPHQSVSYGQVVSSLPESHIPRFATFSAIREEPLSPSPPSEHLPRSYNDGEAITSARSTETVLSPRHTSRSSRIPVPRHSRREERRTKTRRRSKDYEFTTTFKIPQSSSGDASNADRDGETSRRRNRTPSPSPTRRGRSRSRSGADRYGVPPARNLISHMEIPIHRSRSRSRSRSGSRSSGRSSFNGYGPPPAVPIRPSVQVPEPGYYSAPGLSEPIPAPPAPVIPGQDYPPFVYAPPLGQPPHQHRHVVIESSQPQYIQRQKGTYLSRNKPKEKIRSSRQTGVYLESGQVSFTIYGHEFAISPQEIHNHATGRETKVKSRYVSHSSRLSGTELYIYLCDLIRDSLVPLTINLPEPQIEAIKGQSREFLSAFSKDALWRIEVNRSLPQTIHDQLAGTTTTTKWPAVSNRFRRLRFPLVRFDWNIETSFQQYSELEIFSHGLTARLGPTERRSVIVRTVWRAWAKQGGGLAAHGLIIDEIGMSDLNTVVILNRTFHVEDVFIDELLSPEPYPLAYPSSSKLSSMSVVLTSRTLLMKFRNGRRTLGFLVAFSGFFTALKPIIDMYSTTAGWVLVGLGLASALTVIASLGLENLVGYMESQGMKSVQDYDLA